MEKAFHTVTKSPMGATTALEGVVAKEINPHDFLCADRRCRNKGVRVLLVGKALDPGVPEHFRTCTNSNACKVLMGYQATDVVKAEDQHDRLCEFYDWSSSGDQKHIYTRMIDGKRVKLLPGGLFTIAHGQPPSPVGNPFTESPPLRATLRKETGQRHLQGLCDMVRYQSKIELQDLTIDFERIPRSVSDLFVQAENLDALSLDGQLRPYRTSISGDTTAYGTTPHIFYGRASVQLRPSSGAFCRVVFDGGIDLQYAFDTSTSPGTTRTPLSLFVDDGILSLSRNLESFRDDVLALGNAPLRCFAFVLGRLSRLRITTTGPHLNVTPYGSAEDVVLMPIAERSAFTTFDSHIEDAQTSEYRRFRLVVDAILREDQERRAQEEREAERRLAEQAAAKQAEERRIAAAIQARRAVAIEAATRSSATVAPRARVTHREPDVAPTASAAEPAKTRARQSRGKPSALRTVIEEYSNRFLAWLGLR